MNWVDLLVLGVALLSALFGFARGLVREVLGIGAWIGAAVITAVAFPWASSQARHAIANPGIADGVAIAAVFLVCLVVLSLIAAWIGGVVRSSALGGLDRTLGLIFGLARGAVLVVLAYIVVGLIEAPAAWPPAVLEARALPYAYDGAVWMVHLLPPHYRPAVARPPSAGGGAAIPSPSVGSSVDTPKAEGPPKAERSGE
ncbi:MAG: CvpA family protein [Acetobacteraceae bacterium]